MTPPDEYDSGRIRLSELAVGRVVTESSVWCFSGTGHYQRLPRVEQPRGATDCIDDALDDGAWIAYREAWVEPHPAAPGEWRLGIIPAARPPGSDGIRSGVIVVAGRPGHHT